jgi:gamma-glutamylcyclotransferase (GGCT)/AIG2-like uncharacterized protein YtfP
MATQLDTLFVYGTLMRGEPRHHLVADHVVAACPARCEGSLVHMGGYPAMIDPDPALTYEARGQVQGELLLIDGLEDLLPTLDQVEGCTAAGKQDGLYRRVLRGVDMGVVRREAWVYLLEDHVKRGPKIPSGSWRVRHVTEPPQPNPSYGLYEVLMMMEGLRGDGPGSERLLPDEHEPVVSWGGADLVLADRPLLPPPPDYDPWGKFNNYTIVASPHSLALAWLVSELMDRVLWRGLLTDKYSFFEQLGKAANKVLEVRPRASERVLMGAMWCAAADIVSFCGWERAEE